MKFITFTAIVLILVSAASATAANCHSNLFTNNQVYTCQLADGKPVCLDVGDHSSLEKLGLYLFEPNSHESKPLNKMFFHDPAFLGCRTSIFSGCTHETVKITKNKIKAYRYKAPDTWDRRSSESTFNYDFKQDLGVLNIKSYDVDGNLSQKTLTNIFSCR